MLHPLIDQSHLVTSVDKFVQDVLSHQIHFEDITSFLNMWYNLFMLSLDLDLSYAESIHTFVCSTQQVVGDQYPCDVIWDYEKIMKFKSLPSSCEDYIISEKLLGCNQEVGNRSCLDDYIRKVTNKIFKYFFTI